MDDLQLRLIGKSDQQWCRGCQKGDGEVSDDEQALVTAGIEPEQTRHDDHDDANRHRAQQEGGKQTTDDTDAAERDAEPHGSRFADGTRDDDTVGTVDTIDLDIEIIIDDVSSCGDQHDG